MGVTSRISVTFKPACCRARSALSRPGALRRQVSGRPSPGACSPRSGDRGGGRTPGCWSCGPSSTPDPRRTGCSAPRSGAPSLLTVEPGCYFQPDDLTVPETYRGIGVRIEDDVLITPDAHEVITSDVPVLG